MNNIIQKRKAILQNENELFSKTCRKCNEQTFLKEYSKNDRIIQLYKINNIFVYVLKNKNDNSKQIKSDDSAIISVMEIKEITEKDFEDEEYFTSTDNSIGYKTKIENGFWVLLKNDEVRYTLKSNNKKIAVIQIKKNNENSIEQNVFSYSSKIENKIIENLKKDTNIMDVLLNIILESDVQEEVCNIEESLENKSLKLIVKEFELSIKQMKEQEERNGIDEKLLEVKQKYQKVITYLKVETENMNINVNRQQIPINRALIIVKQEKSFMKAIKAIWIGVEKLFRLNVYEGQHNYEKYGGKYE